MNLAKLKPLFYVEMRRDTHSAFAFLATYLWMFFTMFCYGFFFKAALAQKNISFEGHSMNFPLFLVSGLIVVRVIPFSTRIFEETFSSLKNAGLMEWTLTTSSSVWELFLARALWNGVRLAIELTALAVFARICMGTPMGPFFQIAAIAPLFLLFTAYAGIGMIVTGVALNFGRADFLFSAVFQLSAAIGGVFFPTELFSGDLELLFHASLLLPLTHALRIVRFCMIGGDVPRSSLIALSAMAAILALSGVFVLRAGFALARKRGRFSTRLYN